MGEAFIVFSILTVNISLTVHGGNVFTVCIICLPKRTAHQI